MPPRRRTATSTSNFGVGRRESHVADAFYARFEAPELSADEHVTPHAPGVSCLCGDARRMEAVADDSVALVVTSPPYFAGKQYEEELDREGVPGSYIEYLALLRDVFAECKRVLEPGGRIAVNVANLGRKPYRSLAADVMSILQDDLHLLPRGEIVWQKGEGASGSCAWGSFRSAANPVLRDVTERVVVASKGRFGRALAARRSGGATGCPTRARIGADDFMALTLDVWDIPPESAVRVRHPAPFPVELPQRLMELYTYRGDLVVDPFAGSGSTLVAAAALRARRRRLRPRPRLRRARAGRGWPGTRRCRRVTGGGPGAGVGGSASATGRRRRRWPATRSRRPASADVRPNRRLRGLGLAVELHRRPTPAGGRGTSTWRGRTRPTGAAWPAPRRCGARWGGPTSWRPAASRPSSCSRRSCRGPGTEADRALRAPGPGGIFDAVDLLCGRWARLDWRPTPGAGRRAAAGFLGRARRGAGGGLRL